MASTSQVLARKYRPQTFDDLIGQDVLVRTISNAIETNRLAHAYMLTGIRGIGKTTSARIIAKGLNCIGVDGKGGMTPNPCGKCRHCVDITNDAHIDVVEIDAASNTGIDNVRDVIIEGAKYNPVSARFKIYIIDEVHMLSKAAFNALLKTLEEPPERVKFIFATTEIRKVPVTILSRCQRFDLKRLDEKTLTEHLARISLKENVQAEEAALQLIAKAGDGSVRDSLSLLDQAIAHFDGHITTDQVRQMLGLADKTALFDLYEKLMMGDVAAALALWDNQYESGADPIVVATDLLDLTHWLTRLKIVPALIKDISISETERVRGQKLADSLSMAQLTRAWQMLLKGLSEIKNADYPMKAFEMVLIRLAYAAELPTPAEMVAELKKKSETGGVMASVSTLSKTESAPASSKSVFSKSEPEKPVAAFKAAESEPLAAEKKVEPALIFKTIGDISALLRQENQRILAFNVDKCIRPIQLEKNRLVCSLTEEAPRDLVAQLDRFLSAKTGCPFEIVVEENGGGQTAQEAAVAQKQQELSDLQKNPMVAAVLDTFKGAKIESFKKNKAALAGENDSSEEEGE